MDGVEVGDFDEDGGHGGWAAGDEFEIADGGEEGGAPALTLGVAPAFAGLEAEGGEQAVELVVCVGRSDGADQRDSLNHEFDCIVWSATRCGG